MRKRIRFLINTLTGGGAERVLVDLLKQLDPAQYDLSLLTIAGGVYKNEIPPNVNHKCLIKNPQTKWWGFWVKVFFHCPRWLFALLFMRGKFDIEVAYLEGYATRFLSALKTKAKKIVFVHCDVSNKNMISSFYRNNKQCLDEYRSFDKVCFVSEQTRLGFIKTIGELSNAMVVHNVIDYKKVRSLSEQLLKKEYETKGMKLIAVGRLTEVKGYNRLLEVLNELKERYDFELWILGEGEQREELEQYIYENKLNCVKLLGFCSNPYAYMKKADLLISSSFYEGYSTVVAEAVSLALPVLATDTAGMNEILAKGEFGIIVDNSKNGLKQGLIELFTNKDRFNKLKESVMKRSLEISEAQALREYTELFAI